MKQMEVYIEETLVKKIIVDIPDNITDNYEAEIYAENKIRKQYENKEIILTADDSNNMILFATHNLDNDEWSDWHN